jgi:hypothetical protein
MRQHRRCQQTGRTVRLTCNLQIKILKTTDTIIADNQVAKQKQAPLQREHEQQRGRGQMDLQETVETISQQNSERQLGDIQDTVTNMRSRHQQHEHAYRQDAIYVDRYIMIIH